MERARRETGTLKTVLSVKTCGNSTGVARREGLPSSPHLGRYGSRKPFAPIFCQRVQIVQYPVCNNLSVGMLA